MKKDSANNSAKIYIDGKRMDIVFEVNTDEKIYVLTSSFEYDYKNIQVSIVTHTDLPSIGIYPEQEYYLQGLNVLIILDDMKIDEVIKVPGRGNFLRRVA